MSSAKQYIEQLTALDEQAKAPNAPLDVILECIQTPIKWLTETLNPQQQLELVFHKNWKQHVWHVYHDLLPLWTFSFSSIHKDALFSTLFLASSPDQVKINMARTSLPILIECISLTDVDFGTLEIYSEALEFICFSPNIVPYYPLHIPKLDVRFFCSLICSVPTHLANTFGIQLEETRFNVKHEWYIERNFYAKIAQCSAENLSNDAIYYTQELLGKMFRQGNEDIVMESIYNYAKKSPTYWPKVFEQVEIISSPEQVIQSLLYHVKHKESKSITSIAKDISSILLKGASEDRINTFLNVGLLKLSKSSWADDTLTRIIVSAVVFTQPIEQDQVAPSIYSVLLKFAKKVIQYWADPVFIKYASSRERTYLTTSILSLLAYVNDDDMNSEIMMGTPLTSSVSDYFNSGDAATAQLGAIIAEAVSTRIDKDKALDTGLVDTDKLKELKQLIFTRDAFNQEQEMELMVSESESDIQEDKDELLDPDAEYIIHDSEEDSDLEAYYMEEESDDEQESSKKKLAKKPVFVRDLIGCLKDKDDPYKLELGLKEAEQVIRRKTGAGTELSESCIVLAGYLIGFPESFEIDQFRQLQTNALIALIAAVPESVTGFVIDQLYNRDINLGQKQMILASISLAVRELAGWSDNEQHQDTQQVKAIDNAIGQSLFKSTRMEVASRKKVQKNKLSGLAGPVFFFPLLVGWWEGAQGRIKYWIGNNAMLTERFIMTLNIILHSATNTLDKRRIVKEYFEFCLSMRYFKNTSIGIQKALFHGIETILYISYKDQELLLLHDYFQELTGIKEWIEDVMEKQSEGAIQESMTRILLKLSQIANG